MKDTEINLAAQKAYEEAKKKGSVNDLGTAASFKVGWQACEKSFKKNIDINVQESFVDIDELFCNFYKCPNCNDEWIRYNSNYCYQCGVKFNWSGPYD